MSVSPSCLLLLAIVARSAAAEPARPGTWAERKPITFEQLRKGFAQPDMAYAPFAFWFWDEPLQPDKAEKMARKMAEQRFNPGYAHPRTTGPGVAPPNPLPPEQWLSPLWFKSFAAALGQAEAAHAYLGYCDEYMWPSFQAAGRIAREHPELRAVSLDWETEDVPGGTTVHVPQCFFAVAAQLAGTPPKREAQTGARLGQWIWKPVPGKGPHTCYFRKVLELPADATVELATAKLTVDNRYTLFVNGRRIGSSEDWREVRTWDVLPALRPGKNVLAIEGGGDGGIDALLFGLHVALAGGQAVEVPSDETWRVAETTGAGEGWTEPGFDDSRWAPVRVVEADPAAPPWSLPEAGSGPHVPATILSATLATIGKGTPCEWQAPPVGNWRVYVFRQRQHGSVNYLDERLPGVFLPIAHEPYATQFAGRMGASIPGVFVDNEGQYGDRLAWSDTLDRRYREKWGRDIRLWTPLRVDRDVEGAYAKARWEWFEVVTDLYAETMGSTSKWLEGRGMYCISNLWEESLQWQARYVGDFFKLTRAYTMPGNDCLGRKALEVHDFKEVQSISEFEGRRFMSEIMGAGGWGWFSPTSIKQAANAVTAWGVGHVVPHGVFTNRNLVNAQWTPDWYDENPMFPHLHLWTDFVRRASYVNSHGHLVPDVLLVNPMDTVWATAPPQVFDPHSEGGLAGTDEQFGERLQHVNAAYSDAISQLTKYRIEFLVADRHYLRQMEVKAKELVRGPFTFGAVVLPPMDVLPLGVAQLLARLAQAGGRVYALGELPTGSTDNGMGDGQMTALMDSLRKAPTFKECSQGLASALEANAPGLTSQIHFESGAFDMLQHHLRVDGRDLFWLVNNGSAWRQCEVTVQGTKGAAALWDCETGSTRPLPSRATPAGARVRLSFKPEEAYWLVFDPAAAELAEPAPKPAPRAIATLEGPWRVHLSPEGQPNLQFPQDIPAEFRSGTERALAPWQQWGLAHFSGLLDYQTQVEVGTADGPCYLDLGLVYHFAEVLVNGRSVGARLWPPHAFNLTGALKPGRNELVVRVGNLVNNQYGDLREAGLLGPVVLWRGEPTPPPKPKPTDIPRGKPVALQNPTADHSQPSFSVLDFLTDDGKGWGAWDAALKEPLAQTAVVETVTTLGKPGTRLELIFTLKHNHTPPEGLNLGRFRLSATTDDRASFADGKEKGGAVAANWTVLTPIRSLSLQGATMVVEADGSVLVAYGPLERDTYVIVCHPTLSGITGFRLECLEDPRLPRCPAGRTEGGPGRSPGEGNFVVTYFGVEARTSN